MKKIDTIRLLMVLLHEGKPHLQFESGGILYQAVKWHEDIKSMFSLLGVPDKYLEEYAEDYATRIYMMKIKQMIIYSFSF